MEKHGQGLGTGPVNNAGNYASRTELYQKQTQARGTDPFQRPSQVQRQEPYQRPQASGGGTGGNPQPGQRTYQSARRMNASQSGARPGSSAGQSHSARGTGTGPNRASGGGGKLLGIIVVLVMLLGGGKLTGLFDGGNSGNSLPVSPVSGGTNTGSGSSSGSSSSASGGVSDLLSMLMGSGSGSVYDSLGMLSGSSGSHSAQPADYFTSSLPGNSSAADTTVASGAREKYTVLRGGGKDEVTILVYLCGSDLESQNGMGTADLKEMANATIGDRVNLIVYTGGASRWKNSVVSAAQNQIYQIKNGALTRLEASAGNAAMTSPDTLAGFIQYGAKHFPANRMCLILWDHGGGSISGYGYDEKAGRNQSMTLAGINTALKKGGVRFDFIGFDACLMATVENGLMLDQYADYMIASEETEPGVGWYYTNWLTALNANTSLPTVQVGKMIADDFVAVCAQKCRGQATTLSVVDLAELAATVPAELKDFSVETNQLIQNNEYKKVSTARSVTREFAQASRIDQIDLTHFARNLGTAEGRQLADALQGAVKYNRIGGGISNAYGLSIYFPYKRTGQVQKIVSTYEAIGMESEYTRCIQEFASLELSGQVSAGSPLSSIGSGQPYGSMLESLMGGNGSHYTAPSYTGDGLDSLLSGLFSPGGSASGVSAGSTGSILDLFMGRQMTAKRAAAYILDNHFDASGLVWNGNRISLSSAQWSNIVSVTRNIFYDDGKGYIDLGLDPDFTLEGNSLISSFDGTCMSINGQPVAYYYLDTVESGDNYVITGYVPALLNGERVNLMLAFDQDQPYGYIQGAQKVYGGTEPATQPKNYIQIGEGDRVQFICDYFDYQENYQNSYKLGREMILGANPEISNTRIDAARCRVTYCLTDLYQQPYWTPPAP
ncbi:MAG: peptidase C11 [Clostridia bacterium]|nr:peptidase C11 [Clostridia bacterium]